MCDGEPRGSLSAGLLTGACPSHGACGGINADRERWQPGLLVPGTRDIGKGVKWPHPACQRLGISGSSLRDVGVISWSWLFPEGLNCRIACFMLLIKSGKAVNSYGGCFL